MPALRAYLYADPAAHSLSPAMFAAAFAQAGLAGEYRAVRVSPAGLSAALERLRAPGVLGANLSLPHKEAALGLLDRVSPGAEGVGAVNTVVPRGGELHGHNTDVPGLLAALREHELLGEGAVVVLGAGGAARAAVEVARGLGRAVFVLNRSPARAEALAADFRARGAAVQAATPDTVPWAGVGLVVNASAAGLGRPQETPLPAEFLRRLPRGAGVYDMVYAPRDTRLLREAQDSGLRTGGGLSMLAAQAAEGFALMTGRRLPAAVFLHAAQEGTA